MAVSAAIEAQIAAFVLSIRDNIFALPLALASFPVAVNRDLSGSMAAVVWGQSWRAPRSVFFPVHNTAGATSAPQVSRKRSRIASRPDTNERRGHVFREWKGGPRQAEPVAVERGGVVASGEGLAADGGRSCRRPEQARKCFKLDYILRAQEAIAGPTQAARPDPGERCRLCKAITNAEPLVYLGPRQHRASQESNRRWPQ